MVCLDCDLACGLTCLPLPFSCVVSAFRQLRDKDDVGSVGWYGIGRPTEVLVLQSAQVRLVLQRLTFIDDVSAEGRDGVGLVNEGTVVGERTETEMVIAT